MTKVDLAIQHRRDADTVLINYWLYLFVLSWVTLGIYSIVLLFQRMKRIDNFSARKRAYYEGLLQWTERRADQQGSEPSIHHLLGDAREQIEAAYAAKGDMRQINATSSLFLMLVTLGFYGIWVLYRMNRFWWDAQVVEQEFDDKLSQIWASIGLLKYPLSFTVDQGKQRSFWLYFLLVFPTFGIWGIVWDYKIHTDPENLFPVYHSIEDTALQTIRA